MDEQRLLDTIQTMLNAQADKLRGEMKTMLDEQSETIKSELRGEMRGMLDEQSMALRGEVRGMLDEQSEDLKGYVREEIGDALRQNNLAIADIVTEAAEKAVETVSVRLDGLEHRIGEVEAVAAQNAYDVQLMKRRA